MKKKFSKKVKYFLVAVIGVFLSGSTIIDIIKNEYSLYKLKKEKKRIIEENKKLAEMIEYANTREFIEYNARIKLGLKKDDEIEYRFTPPKDDE